MTIALGKVGKGTGAGGNITANWTGGGSSTAGSTLVAIYSDDGQNSALPTTPAGWTKQASAADSFGTFAVYYITSASAITGLSLTVSGTADANALDILEFTGAGLLDSSTAIANQSAVTTETTNAITTVAATTVMVALFAARSGNTTPRTLSTPGAGFTQTQTNNQSVGASFCTTNYSTYDIVSTVQTSVSTTCAVSVSTNGHAILLAFAAGQTSLTFPTASKFIDPLPEPEPWRAIAQLNQSLKTTASGLLQSTSSRFANSSLAQTIGFTSNVSNNNLLVAAISTNNITTPAVTVTVTDSMGNVWAQAGGYVVQSSSSVSLWYAVVQQSSGPNAVSFTPSVACNSAMAIFEYSGYRTLDGTSSGQAGPSVIWGAGTCPVNNANELVIAAFTNNDIGNQFTSYNGFVLQADPSNTSVSCGLYVQDLRASAPIQAWGKHNLTQYYAAASASFAAFTAPAPPSTWQPFAVRTWDTLLDPEPWRVQNRYPTGVFTQTVFQSWTFPLGRKWLDPVPEPEPWRATANLNVALKTAQSTKGQSNSARFARSSSARSVAYSGNVTAGNLLVVCVTSVDPTQINSNTFTISDSLNNNYQQIPTANTANAGVVSTLWYTISHYSGADTVTITPSSNVFMSIAVFEYTGNTGLLDGITTSTGSTSSGIFPHSTSPVGVNASSDLVIAFFGANDTGNHFSALEGFVLQENPVNASDNAALYVMDMSASSPIRAWMNNSTASINYTAIVVSFFSGSSLPTHPFQPMASKWFPAFVEPVVEWTGKKMPPALLPGFSQTGSPWSFPKTIKLWPTLPEPEVWHQRRLLSPNFLTNGVTPNPSPWQPFAQRNWPTLVDPVISQGLTEPGRRWNPGGLFPGFTKPISFNLVPWDHNQTPVTQRHQRLVCQILNTLIQAGEITQEQATNFAPIWHLSYNPSAPINWAGVPPAKIMDALDRIAAKLAALGQKP